MGAALRQERRNYFHISRSLSTSTGVYHSGSGLSGLYLQVRTETTTVRREWVLTDRLLACSPFKRIGPVV